MRLAYLAFIRLPTEKAHGLQIMKECEALAAAGLTVELIIPGRATHTKIDPFTYYGVERTFTIRTLPSIDLTHLSSPGFVLSQLLFGARALLYLSPMTPLLSQDEWVLLLPSLCGRTCFYEAHNGRANDVARRIAARSPILLTNSQGTKQFYVDQGVAEKNIRVVPNGVDQKRFDISMTQEEARSALGLPVDKYLIMYTGHLYDWKGVDILAESARELPSDTDIVFVGGTERDVAAFRARYRDLDRVRILGHKPTSDIPLYARAADVLALPNVRLGESERFTSPMKLFEYLAAGKPIVASDLPSLREILDESVAYFAPPGDVHGLTQVLNEVRQNPKEAGKRAAKAHQMAARYTWNRQSIADEIRQICRPGGRT